MVHVHVYTCIYVYHMDKYTLGNVFLDIISPTVSNIKPRRASSKLSLGSYNGQNRIEVLIGIEYLVLSSLSIVSTITT